MRRAATWAAILAAIVGLSWALDEAGLSSPQLFAALLVGLAVALTTGARRPRLPEPVFPAGQAVLGVVLGTYLHTSTLTALGTRWIPVVLVSLATLAVTTGLGLLMARVTSADPVTASLGTVAGGASGITAMAGQLGGDDRVVAFMQYLRVLVVLLITPLSVATLFGAHGGAPPGDGTGLLSPASGWLLVALVAPLGAFAGQRLKLPSGVLLGPLLLAAVVTLSGLSNETAPPGLLRDGSFIVIGLQIGLRFTMEQVRMAGRLLLPVLASVVVLIVVCGGLGLILTETTGVSTLDGYLATTPGGIYAVLPIAYGSGANTTFVLAVQTMRLFMAVLAAPVVTRRLLRTGWHASRAAGGHAHEQAGGEGRGGAASAE